MVMCLVLKEKKPRLNLSVNLYINFYRAGVDFFGFIKLFKLAVLSQILNRNGCKVHKTN